MAITKEPETKGPGKPILLNPQLIFTGNWWSGDRDGLQRRYRWWFVQAGYPDSARSESHRAIAVLSIRSGVQETRRGSERLKQLSPREFEYRVYNPMFVMFLVFVGIFIKKTSSTLCFVTVQELAKTLPAITRTLFWKRRVRGMCAPPFSDFWIPCEG